MAKLNFDKVQSTIVGNIESVVAEVDLPNGALVALGESKGRELMEAVAPDADKELLVVKAPEVKYNALEEELDYVTPKGKPVTAFHLTEGDKFQVELTLFEDVPAVGDVYTGSTNYGYKKAVGSERTKFVVEQLTKFGYDRRDMALLRVVSV